MDELTVIFLAIIGFFALVIWLLSKTKLDVKNRKGYYEDDRSSYRPSSTYIPPSYSNSSAQREREDEERRAKLEEEAFILRQHGASDHFVDSIDNELGRTGAERDFEDNRTSYKRKDW